MLETRKDSSSRNQEIFKRLVFLFPLAVIFVWILGKALFGPQNPFYLNLIREDGVIENAQSFFYFLSSLCAFNLGTTFFKSAPRSFGILFYLLGLALLFIFFEEISWGQRFFHWKIPGYFIFHNTQREITIHNLSNVQTLLHLTYFMIGLIGGLAWLIFPKLKSDPALPGTPSPVPFGRPVRRRGFAIVISGLIGIVTALVVNPEIFRTIYLSHGQLTPQDYLGLSVVRKVLMIFGTMLVLTGYFLIRSSRGVMEWMRSAPHYPAFIQWCLPGWYLTFYFIPVSIFNLIFAGKTLLNLDDFFIHSDHEILELILSLGFFLFAGSKWYRQKQEGHPENLIETPL